jgi:hypothetical protein
MAMLMMLMIAFNVPLVAALDNGAAARPPLGWSNWFATGDRNQPERLALAQHH